MDTVYFLLSKCLGLFLSPEIVLLMLFYVGTVLLYTRWQKRGRQVITVTVILSVLIAILPVGNWLLSPLENAFPARPALPATVDGIIVLGGGLDTLASENHNSPQLNAAGDRLTTAAMLARRYPDARLLFSGGSGLLRHPNLREADFAKDFFSELGLGTDRVFFESASRNTWENALYSKQVAGPGSEETWVLVTSASHMPRAIGAFCKQDWAVIPWPADFRSVDQPHWQFSLSFSSNLEKLEYALHEYIGLMVYALTGKSTSLFPDGC